MENKLTITFFSNFLLHHQTPFCEAMVKLIGDNFRFVATERIPQDRLQMGYSDLSHSEKYAINSYENYEAAKELGKNSDVVIIGNAPDEFVFDRLKENKLTFRYCERYFKEGRWRILDPRVFVSHFKRDFIYRNKNLYMLCASAYTAPDCRFIFSYPNKMYKWGYFPEFIKYDVDKLIKEKTQFSILWVGRFLKLKHPEAAIQTANELKKSGYEFNLTMIGEGEEKEVCQKLIDKYGLNDKVQMLGFMSPEKVRENMEKADIFLFTSDHNEGWGAVLNEAMNSACAVVGCREIGSVPYVIKSGENGLVYDRHGKNTLISNVKTLLDNKELKQKIQRNAYDTMASLWNAETAANRLLQLIKNIENGETTNYVDGPCSKG